MSKKNRKNWPQKLKCFFFSFDCVWGASNEFCFVLDSVTPSTAVHCSALQCTAPLPQQKSSGNLDNEIYKDIWIYMDKSWISTDMFGTWICFCSPGRTYPKKLSKRDIHDISNAIHVDLHIYMYLNISKHGYLVLISCTDILIDVHEISITYPCGLSICIGTSKMDILCGYLAWIS